MQKIYSSDLKLTPKNEKKKAVNGLKPEVLNNLLGFSKSLEVLKSTMPGKRGNRNVEIVLN